MPSKLNVDYAKRRGLSKQDIRSLKALHFAMDSMVRHQNALHELELLSTNDIKRLRKRVRDMEFLMQELWEFGPNELNHTHWRRFDALYLPVGTVGFTREADLNTNQ